MILRTAVIVPVVVVICTGAMILTWVATTSRPLESSSDSAVVAAPMIASTARTVRTVATPTAPPPALYVRPVGDQYLGVWGRRLATTEDGPPHWFLLSAAELASSRYGWELPALAEAMAEELGAVLAEGCRARACTAEVEQARASLRAFVDDDRSTRTFGAPHTRRWITGEDVPEEHRRIDIAGRAEATSFDVECNCTSWTIGMRMWNDLAECTATLRAHGRTLLTYAPSTKRISHKEPLLSPLDAYDQIVTFASGATLTIESGYSYAGDGVTTPLTRGSPRGTLKWATTASATR
jgi:hypothetical protein